MLAPALSDAEVEQFVEDGYIRLEAAFPRSVAERCVDVLWRAMRPDADDPDSWTTPVVRVAGSGAEPLVTAINDDRLCGAIDQLVGPGRWQRRTGYGTFPIRFPSEVDPGDAGWHVDGSYEAGDEPPPWNLHVNLWSRERALLLLMLFSDVGPDDAPTLVRVGSHLDVAPTLVEHGRAGVPFAGIADGAGVAERPVGAVTGRAGDVYLCHPFLVHRASWPHRGRSPRFMGQPCIHHRGAGDGSAANGYDYGRPAQDRSACERAVIRGLERAGIGVPDE